VVHGPGDVLRRADQMNVAVEAAHGQDVTVYDWPQIVRLARRVEALYRKARD
jgi:hypothetical protein